MISISKLYCGAAEPGDALRYGAAGEGGVPAPAGRRPIIVWNSTRRCNLRCVHCYSRSEDRPYAGELETAEAEAMLEDLARFGAPVVLFSGGEPLLRPDLVPLVAKAVGLGLRAVVSTNGTLLTPETAGRLKAAGAAYVGVSLDGLGEANDRFRGVPGAFARALKGIRACRDAGLRVGLRFTITRRNVGQMEGIFRLVREEGIPRVCFYHLVYAGRGSDLMAEDLDAAATRRAVDAIIDRTADLAEAGQPTEVLTVDNHADGPYLVLRMRRENHPRASQALDLLKRSRGNASGIGIGCVSWDGSVHPDQFWRHESLGNVRERPFSEIWTDTSHPLMARLKDRRPHLKGRCARCRWLDVCNGNFRVRAEAATGNLWAPDPACYLTDEEIAPGDAP